MKKFILMASLCLIGMVVCMYQLYNPANPMQVNTTIIVFLMLGCIMYLCVDSIHE